MLHRFDLIELSSSVVAVMSVLGVLCALTQVHTLAVLFVSVVASGYLSQV